MWKGGTRNSMQVPWNKKNNKVKMRRSENQEGAIKWGKCVNIVNDRDDWWEWSFVIGVGSCSWKAWRLKSTERAIDGRTDFIGERSAGREMFGDRVKWSHVVRKISKNIEECVKGLQEYWGRCLGAVGSAEVRLTRICSQNDRQAIREKVA